MAGKWQEESSRPSVQSLYQVRKATAASLIRGGSRSRIFSRGDLKKIRKFCRPFFRSTKLIFRALPKQLKDPVLVKFSVQQANFVKNRPKRRSLPPPLSLSLSLSLSKLVYIGAFRKFLGSVSKYGVLTIGQRGVPLGW